MAVIFGFFGFLRQSNLAPKSVKDFDNTRHTTRGDVKFQDPGLVISLQCGGEPHEVPLPKLQNKLLCPVRAYKRLLKVAPTVSPQQPLLTLKPKQLLCCPKLSAYFKHILSDMGLNHELYSLQSLHRGGASAAVQGGAGIASAKNHGHWRSEAFWDYVVAEAPHQSQVAKVFKNLT